MDAEEIHASLERIAAPFDVGPGGIAISIEKEGARFECFRGRGNEASNTPISEQTRFRVASLTKQFTVALALSYSEEGKLDLSAPIGTYLPGLSDFVSRLRVESLLRVISGLRDFYETAYLCGGGRHSALTESDLVDLINCGPDPNFPEGARFRYSNTGFFLIGRALENISGEPLETLYRKRLFDPTGMAHSLLCRDERESLPDLAQPYAGVDKPLKPFVRWPLAAQGGLVSTVSDLHAWNRWLHALIASNGVFAAMAHPTVLSDGATCEHGMGLFVRTWNNTPFIYHSGALPGWRSFLAWSERDDASIVILANRDDFDVSALAEVVTTLTLGPDNHDNYAPPAIRDDAWFGDATGRMQFHVMRETDDAFLDTGFATKKLQPITDNRFMIPPRYAGVVLEVDKTGNPIGYVTPGGHTPLTKIHPSPIDLSLLLGAYTNSGLDCTLRFVQKDAEQTIVEIRSRIGRRDWRAEPSGAGLVRLTPENPLETDFPNPFVMIIRPVFAAGQCQALEISTSMNEPVRFERSAASRAAD